MSMAHLILLIFLTALIVGPRKLPALAAQLGRVLSGLKQTSDALKNQLATEMTELDAEKLSLEAPKRARPSGQERDQ